MRFFFILSALWMSPAAQADDFIYCANPDKCCPKRQTAVAQPFIVEPEIDKKGAVYTCGNLVNGVVMSLSGINAVPPKKCPDCPISPSISAAYSENGSSIAWLIDAVQKFPKNCGYSIPKVTKQMIQSGVDLAVKGQVPKCIMSHCVGATFTALAVVAKRLLDEGKIGKDLFNELTHVTKDEGDSAAYKYLNVTTNPKALVEHFKLGEGRVIRREDIPASAKENWPGKGDFVQLWRPNGSGHSLIFAGYLYDAEKKPIAICYWTSNQSTKGYGNRCEPLDRVKTLTAGRITL